MFKNFREDLRAIKTNDPAAKSYLEILLCHVPLHSITIHRFAHFIEAQNVADHTYKGPGQQVAALGADSGELPARCLEASKAHTLASLEALVAVDVSRCQYFGGPCHHPELFNTALVCWSMYATARGLTPPDALTADDEAIKPIAEGVELTLKSFLDVLGKQNIEVVDPNGEPFDPNLHQAMSMVENSEVEPNSVIAVMQKGYTLNGRLLRPAMVMVSKAAG